MLEILEHFLNTTYISVAYLPLIFLFLFQKKVWLPDNVFPNPGMSETEMVEFMKSRGASHRCIKYARNKYSEVNSEGSVVFFTRNLRGIHCQNLGIDTRKSDFVVWV